MPPNTINDIREDDRVYDHKTNFIMELRPSHQRTWLYHAIIHDIKEDKMFIIAFGCRYKHFRYDKTVHRGLYSHLECDITGTTTNWQQSHSKWQSRPICRRWLEWVYLMSPNMQIHLKP